MYFIYICNSGIENIIFDEQRSRVIIETEKPGLAIGKQGDLLREIRKNILWVPLVRRTPAIKSKIIESRYILVDLNQHLHFIFKRHKIIIPYCNQ